jgi:hypothetical protein
MVTRQVPHYAAIYERRMAYLFMKNCFEPT